MREFRIWNNRSISFFLVQILQENRVFDEFYENDICYENQIRDKRMMSLIFLTRIPRLPRLSI